jgi:hypothetical protein
MVPASIIAATRDFRRKQVIFLANAAFFVIYALGYRAEDALVNILPALLLLAFVLVPAFARFRFMGLVLPLSLLMLNFLDAGSQEHAFVRSSSLDLLREAPPNAILLTEGDRTTFNLWYFTYGEGQRPDVIMVDTDLFAFPWYRKNLQSKYPQLAHLARDDVAGFRKVNATERPVCDVSLSRTGSRQWRLSCSNGG